MKPPTAAEPGATCEAIHVRVEPRFVSNRSPNNRPTRRRLIWSIARWLKALLVKIARHQPEVKSYRQKWEFVDLIFRINVASLKVKIMNLRVMK